MSNQTFRIKGFLCSVNLINAMKQLTILAFVLSPFFLFSQQSGSIVGKISDKEQDNDPLPFADARVQGTTLGATTDFDGLFEIPNVTPGTYTVIISFVGYETLEIPNVVVEPNKVTEVVTSLGQTTVALETVVVTAVSKRESQVALLLEQKTAAQIQTKIGLEALKELGIGDVETGLTQASGVATSESKLYVRGLGDRYNNAYLNGFPLPSFNPKQKLIDLDIFPTNVVENLGVFKSYSSLLYGDFAGASVDINTKDNPGDGFFEVSAGLGVNTVATFGDFFLLNGGNYDYLGIDDGARRIPSIIDAFRRIPGITYDSNFIPVYQFKTSFNPGSRYENLPDLGLALSGGKRFTFKNEDVLDFLLSMSFRNKKEARLDGFETIRNAQGEIFRSAFGTLDDEYRNYDRFQYQTNSTLLGSLRYRFDPDNNLTFTTLLVNDTYDELWDFIGLFGEADEEEGRATIQRRGTYEQNKLGTYQLNGEHYFTNRKYKLDWGGAYNYTEQNVPDRRQLYFSEREDGTFILGNSTNTDLGNQQRFWAFLEEHDISTNVSFTINFDEDEDGNYKNKLIIGSNVRDKRRDFDAFQTNYRIDSLITTPVDPLRPDDLLSQENFEDRVYTIFDNARPSNQYKADFNNIAGFADFQWAFAPRWVLIAGLRIEDFEQNVFFRSINNPNLDDIFQGQIQETFVLPSLNFKYEATDKSNLRFAASQTVVLPLFTETAPFLDEGVVEVTIGNPGLTNSTSNNFDVKYEIFPRAGELISVAGFYKYIDKPIEKTTVASANNLRSFINGENANVAGIELEYRQKLSNVFAGGNDNSPWSYYTFGFNGTLMFTEVKIDPDTTIDFDLEGTDPAVPIVPTNLVRQMQGASPFIINANINYRRKFGNHDISSTIDYNFFGDRIYAAGAVEIGDIFEEGYNTLNFNFIDNIGEHWGITFRALNLLNPPIRRYQDQEDLGERFTLSRYNLGVDLQLGFTYKF